MNPKSRKSLNIKKVMAEFQQAEKSSSRRKGTFKIDKPFEGALDSILKARSDPAKPASQYNAHRRKTS